MAKTYSQSGVDYSAMDPIKVLAQKKAKGTSSMLKSMGLSEVTASRGESAYVWEEEDAYRSLVIEGLGTKNLVADAMREVTGKTYYDQIAKDTVAMIVNDLIVVGALPEVINAYFAIGDSNWMKDEERAIDLINGWAKACELAGAAWGGGETPTLKNIIQPATIDLAGSAVGSIKPKGGLVLGDKIQEGDVIILIESSGIHANGITLARSIADELPKKYATKLPSGKTYGEALLSPTHIYVPLVRKLLEAETDIHYMVNITGHGWRKLMRANKEVSYEIDAVPKPQEEFDFIQKQAGISDHEMYGNFNMGAGFAVFLPKSESGKALKIAKQLRLKAEISGTVKKGAKKVLIKPKNIVFETDSLEVR